MAAAGPTAVGSRHRSVAVDWLLKYPVLWMSLLLFAAVVPVRPEMASAANLELLLLSAALLAVLAIGQTFVLIIGGIDLSLPAVMSLASVTGAAVLSALSPASAPWLAVTVTVSVMLMVGIVIGILQGLAVAVGRMPPFLVTLASLIGVGGLGLYLTQSGRTAVLESFTELWYGRPGGVPLPVIWVGALAVATHYLLAHTVMGRRLYAVGHNLAAAHVSGVPLVRTIVCAYSVSGFCAAVAAVLYTARLYSGSPQLVENEVLLDCIGAAVIGGTSLFGGRGRISGTLLGVFFMALLGNSLNMLGLRYWHVIMVKGGVILCAAMLDMLRSRLGGED